MTKRKRRLFWSLSKVKRLVNLLWPYARSHKGLLAFGVALSAAMILFRLAQPWPLKWIVDALTRAPSQSLLLTGLGPEHHIVLYGLAYVALTVVAGLLEYWQQLVLAGVGNRILFGFRNQLFGHLLRLPLRYHERRTVGELVTRVVSDTARLRRGVNGILIRAFQTIFAFLVSALVLLLLNWVMALVVALCLAVSLVVLSQTGNRILVAAQRNRRREGQLAGVVAEDLHGIRELHTFKGDAPKDDRFENRNVKSLKNEQKLRRLEAGLLFRMETVLGVAIATVVTASAVNVYHGNLSLGTLVLFVHYAVGLYGPFRQFAQQAARSGRTMACVKRLEKILQEEPAVQDAPDARPLEKVPEVIRFSNVWFKSQRQTRTGRKWQLENVSFEIRQGDRVAMLGKNGAGKSTLLRLLLRIDDPQDGSINLDGQEIRNFRLSSWRSRMSVVFQESVFFGLTVRENIMFGRPDATADQVQEVVRCLGLEKWIESLKQGYDTPVRRQGILFSGGERQKLALARGLLQNGDIWLLDEPTTGLDEPSVEEITRQILTITDGRTTFWATHDQDILDYCNRVLFLQSGRLLFEGTPEQFSVWRKKQGVSVGFAKDQAATP